MIVDNDKQAAKLRAQVREKEQEIDKEWQVVSKAGDSQKEETLRVEKEISRR